MHGYRLNYSSISIKQEVRHYCLSMQFSPAQLYPAVINNGIAEFGIVNSLYNRLSTVPCTSHVTRCATVLNNPRIIDQKGVKHDSNYVL